jgi:hypothetical protein
MLWLLAPTSSANNCRAEGCKLYSARLEKSVWGGGKDSGAGWRLTGLLLLAGCTKGVRR